MSGTLSIQVSVSFASSRAWTIRSLRSHGQREDNICVSVTGMGRSQYGTSIMAKRLELSLATQTGSGHALGTVH